MRHFEIDENYSRWLNANWIELAARAWKYREVLGNGCLTYFSLVGTHPDVRSDRFMFVPSELCAELGFTEVRKCDSMKEIYIAYNALDSSRQGIAVDNAHHGITAHDYADQPLPTPPDSFKMLNLAGDSVLQWELGHCPHCGAASKIPWRFIGRTGVCRKCGKKFCAEFNPAEMESLKKKCRTSLEACWLHVNIYFDTGSPFQDDKPGAFDIYTKLLAVVSVDSDSKPVKQGLLDTARGEIDQLEKKRNGLYPPMLLLNEAFCIAKYFNRW
jgi:hypothetical protein